MNDLKRTTTLVLICWLAAATAHADWLVTQAGERIETRGGWEVRGRAVIFTRPNGTLSSLRLSQVDLEASAEATERAAAAADAADAAPPQPSAPRQPVRVITTEDVGEGQPGAEGPELLIERLRQAHRFQDLGLALGLINWQDVPESMRQDIENRFQWMIDHPIRNIRFVAADPDEANLQQVQDDVVYEPNVEVAGSIEIEFVPDPDEAEVLLKFPVGTRLGTYFIAAPREAAN